MKTFKDKIINYKKQPEPSSWERILPIVEAQNNQGESSKIKGLYSRLPKALLLLLLSLCALGFYTFERTKSKEGMISDVKKSNQQIVIDERLVANEHSDINSKEIVEIKEKVKSVPEVSLANKEKSNSGQAKSNTSNLFLTSNTKIKSSGNKHKNSQIFDSQYNTQVIDQNESLTNVEIETAKSPILSKSDEKNEVVLESEIDNNIGKGEQEIVGGENLNVVIALPNEKINNIYSLYASDKDISPCKPCSNRHLFELGISAGPGSNLYYSGYFTNLLFEYKLSKLLRAGIRFNYQRYAEGAKYITAPDVVSKDVYLNLAASLSLVLMDKNKLSIAIDLLPCLQLVSEHKRTQNRENFYLVTSQYHGLNYMIGANIDYKITSRWKLGLESVMDVNGETTMHGLRAKYNL